MLNEFISQGDTFTIEEADNDGFGDGNAQSCEELTFFLTDGTTVEEKVGLAIGLLFVGIFVAWLGYYIYNRWQSRKVRNTWICQNFLGSSSHLSSFLVYFFSLGG